MLLVGRTLLQVEATPHAIILPTRYNRFVMLADKLKLKVVLAHHISHVTGFEHCQLALPNTGRRNLRKHIISADCDGVIVLNLSLYGILSGLLSFLLNLSKLAFNLLDVLLTVYEFLVTLIKELSCLVQLFKQVIFLRLKVIAGLLEDVEIVQQLLKLFSSSEQLSLELILVVLSGLVCSFNLIKVHLAERALLLVYLSPMLQGGDRLLVLKYLVPELQNLPILVKIDI